MSNNKHTSREYGLRKLYGANYQEAIVRTMNSKDAKEKHTIPLSKERITITRETGRKMLEVLASMNGDLTRNQDNLHAAQELKISFEQNQPIATWAGAFLHLYYSLEEKYLKEVEPLVQVEPISH